MKRKKYDFFKNKIIFIDYLSVEAGVGNNKRGPPTKMMPYGIKWQIFKPEITKKPILIADKPWESGFIGVYVSLLQENDKVRLWYEAYPSNSNINADNETLLCYAESLDNGETFQKPELNLVEWNDSKQNNILITPEMHNNKRGMHGTAIFKDKNPKCPIEEKYKTVFSSIDNNNNGHVYGATSPDGLHWNFIDGPIAKTWADTQTIIEWNNELEKYIGFFRSWHFNRRQIYYGETEDFKKWDKIEPLITSDPNLPIDHDFYTNGFISWPDTKDAYLMFPSIYRRTIDNLYVEMRTSRNLKEWYRSIDNPIIKPEDISGRFRGGVYLAHGLLQKDRNWLIPIGFPLVYHNEIRKKNKFLGEIYLAKWREDGFTGLVAEEKGEFWTQNGNFAGRELFINGWTHPRGSIEVEIIDNFTSLPLPGLSFKECIPIEGNGEHNWRKFNWKEKIDLTDFDDVEIRLHFRIIRGTIHGYQFRG